MPGEVMIRRHSISIDFDPKILDRKIKGGEITAYIELLRYDVSKIDISKYKVEWHCSSTI